MKYFYNDPLAAAWMAKHFGMRFNFICEDEGILYRPTNSDFIDSVCGIWERIAYIHPDSLHLLEPHMGDYIIEHAQTHDVFLIDDAGYGKSCTLLEAQAWIKEGDRIIQRNGMAFMWPESEE